MNHLDTNTAATSDITAVAGYLKTHFPGSDFSMMFSEQGVGDNGEDSICYELDMLVFDCLGDSRTVSDTINNAGMERQIEAVLSALGYERGVAAIFTHLNQSDAFNDDALSVSDYLAWFEWQRHELRHEALRTEIDFLRNIIDDNEQLEAYMAKTFHIANRSFSDLHNAVTHGLAN